MYSRGRKKVFKLMRRLPYVRDKINAEMDKIKSNFEEEVIKNSKGVNYITELPVISLTNDEILKKVEEHLNLGKVQTEIKIY